MKKYDIFLLGLGIGIVSTLIIMAVAFNTQTIPSKLSELQSQYNLETHKVMPDEIIINNSLECIENKTIEYFAGFDKNVICKKECIVEETCSEYYLEDCPDGFCLYERNVSCSVKTITPNTCLKFKTICEPIQNRTYCVKAIEVIKR